MTVAPKTFTQMGWLATTTSQVATAKGTPATITVMTAAHQVRGRLRSDSLIPAA